jgi:hypothetical protein
VTKKAAPVTRCIAASSTPVAVSWAADRGAPAETTANRAAATRRGAPPAGTPNGQCEQSGADGEREKRGEGDQEDADLGHEGTRDLEGHVRGTSAGPQRDVHESRDGRSGSRSLELREALGGSAEPARAGRGRSNRWYLQKWET